jgi:hypothetical protein
VRFKPVYLRFTGNSLICRTTSDIVPLAGDYRAVIIGLKEHITLIDSGRGTMVRTTLAALVALSVSGGLVLSCDRGCLVRLRAYEPDYSGGFFGPGAMADDMVLQIDWYREYLI